VPSARCAARGRCDRSEAQAAGRSCGGEALGRDHPRGAWHCIGRCRPKAGLNARSARAYLGRPHVIAYYRAEKQRLLEEVSLGNPASLVDVRDNSPNSMARVQAARTLEAMRVDAVADGGRERRHTPGLVVIITGSNGEVTQTIGGEPPPPMIDVTPERDALEQPPR
jgi:hypothetical protein